MTCVWPRWENMPWRCHLEFRNHTLPNGLQIVAECNENAYSTAKGLFYSALNFKGDSLAMAACRSCYNNGVAKSYNDGSTESECDVCARHKLELGAEACGTSPHALDKMTELIKDKSCLQNGTAWHINVRRPNGTYKMNIKICIRFFLKELCGLA